MPVSYETPPHPSLLGELFDSRVDAAHRYAECLVTTAVERGLIGPRETGLIWSRHILNCAAIAPAFTPGSSVCDLGSGAGLPGVVLALCRPDLRLTLVEPSGRRAAFLELVTSIVALPVEVVRARAEELQGARRFDYVTARAVAPLSRLVTWSLPLCMPGGELIAMKGGAAREEAAAASPVIRRLGGAEPKFERFGKGVVTPETLVVRIQSQRG